MLECAIHPITYRGEGILATIVKNEGTVILSECLVLQEAYNIFWHILLN